MYRKVQGSGAGAGAGGVNIGEVGEVSETEAMPPGMFPASVGSDESASMRRFMYLWMAPWMYGWMVGWTGCMFAVEYLVRFELSRFLKKLGMCVYMYVEEDFRRSDFR